MKNNLKNGIAAFLLVTAVTISSPAWSQGPYAGIGLAFGLPVAGSTIGTNSETNQPAGTFSDEIVHGSYGKGLSFGGYFGYMANENLGLELGVNYLLGSKYKLTDNRTLSSNVTDNTSEESKGRSLRLVPAVRLTYGDGSIRPYIRGGVVIAVMNKITYDATETFTNPSGTSVTETTFEYYKGVAFGIAGGLGVNFSLSDNMFLSAEINNYFYSWSPNKGHFTKFTTDGADQLAGMTTDQKEFEYVDKTDQSMNNSNSQPTTELRSWSPMSSIGLQVGVHFTF